MAGDNSLITIGIVLLPLAFGFVMLFLPGRLKALFKSATLAVSALAFVLAVNIFLTGKGEFSLEFFSIGQFNLSLLLAVTTLGSFILMFACGFGVLITIYSLKSEDTRGPNIYYGSILLTIGGSAGILLSNHLLFLLIFWEIVTASLYLLLTTGAKNSGFAATKTFAMIGASDAALLLGIAIAWHLGGTFVISKLSLSTGTALEITAFMCLMLAAITKAGALPLHTWLPTSGQYGPTSVMAFLPAALDKLLGIYLLVLVVRELFVLTAGPLSFILALIGSATIIIAVMVAMVQHNLNKLLSYHAISQVGYMILGIATMTPVGIAGGLFHMLNNAIYKSCLFLCGGAAQKQAGTAELDKLGGLGRKMSITFTTCLIAALSISGIPPLNGFVSKWMVYQGVIEMGSTQTAGVAMFWPVWLVAAMFGSALTLASFVKVLHSVFLSRMPERLKDVKEAPASMTLPMIVLAALCVIFGVFYHIPLKNFIYPALGIDPQTAVLSGSWQSFLATVMIIIGIMLGLAVVLIGLIGRKIRYVPSWYCGENQTEQQMIVPGTHFYKTVSSMAGLKRLYTGQQKGYFDLYNQCGRLGLALTGFLRWLHCGILSTYLTWVTLGLLIVLFIVCRVW